MGLLTEPRRVKVRGDLFHGRVPVGATYVGRAAPGLTASIYANPFKAGEPIKRDSELWPFIAAMFPPGALDQGFGGPLQSVTLSREQSVDAYSRRFFEIPALLLNASEQLGGRDLCCWCKIPRAGEPDHCHAAWLLGLAKGLVNGDE
jgi:hypothetical protein